MKCPIFPKALNHTREPVAELTRVKSKLVETGVCMRGAIYSLTVVILRLETVAGSV